jgi:hypothetical protein
VEDVAALALLFTELWRRERGSTIASGNRIWWVFEERVLIESRNDRAHP